MTGEVETRVKLSEFDNGPFDLGNGLFFFLFVF